MNKSTIILKLLCKVLEQLWDLLIWANKETSGGNKPQTLKNATVNPLDYAWKY